MLPAGLIVNADDLGIHPRINAGIRSAFEHGILTSCTMLVTTPFLHETVCEFVKPRILPIGLHLALTQGKATAPLSEVPDLVDGSGDFVLSAAQLLSSNLSQKSKLLVQVRREFECQLSLALDCGLRPTHVDSHQHVHMNPALFSLLQNLLPRFGINRIRFCTEPLWGFSLYERPYILMKRSNYAKWAVLKYRSKQIKPSVEVNDLLFGILYSGCVSKSSVIRAICASSNNLRFEICIHPGFPADESDKVYPRANYNAFISSKDRQREHDILLDEEVRAAVAANGWVLRSYNGRTKVPDLSARVSS